MPPLLSTGLVQFELEVRGGGLTEVVTPYLGLFFFNDPATTEIFTLSLHAALPISLGEIEMLASTYCLTAGPLSPLRPSPVARVTATPPIVTTALALAVKVPAAGLFMGIGHVGGLPPLLRILRVPLDH